MNLFELRMPVYPGDMRALSPAELQKWANDQYALMGQAQQNPYGSLAYLNWLRPSKEQRPLDERFADFKLRLAKALEKRKEMRA